MKQSYLRWQTRALPEGLEVKVRRHGPSHNGAAIVRVVLPWPADGTFPSQALEQLINRVRPTDDNGVVGLNTGLGGNG